MGLLFTFAILFVVLVAPHLIIKVAAKDPWERMIAQLIVLMVQLVFVPICVYSQILSERSVQPVPSFDPERLELTPLAPSMPKRLFTLAADLIASLLARASMVSLLPLPPLLRQLVLNSHSQELMHSRATSTSTRPSRERSSRSLAPLSTASRSSRNPSSSTAAVPGAATRQSP